ncbi:hypothetical protein PIB30_049818 [Stylosanthes scabra]|uniref:VQ domain-containing protein n=1 Tax=Stylosanthes scabra TaxID=79078 RepID=A0ABU6VJ21_9FABA|nr:hypothetical protein [Stylosanthes scabra]
MSGAMATTTTTTDHHQWMMQFYDEQPQMDCDGNMAPIMEAFSDATVVTTMSPESTSSMILSPKRNAFKPIKKRSKASRRTPTTLLNANTNNFRELVQKFTGCGSTDMSLAIHKGPITLNFQQGTNNKNQKILHQQQQQKNSTKIRGTVSPFGTRTSNHYYYYNNNQQAHHHGVAAVVPSQEQQSGGGGLISNSLDSDLPSYDVDYLSSSRPSSIEASDEFGFHQLTVNDDFSNVLRGVISSCDH